MVMQPPRPAVDLDPLQEWEYERIQGGLAPHWRLFFRLLWETGMRVSEGLAVERADLIEPDLVRVRRLKKKRVAQDEIPLPVDLFAALLAHSRYLRTRRLFPYTRAAAHFALVKAATAAVIRIAPDGQSSVHAHLYRHGLGRRAARLLLGLSAYDQEMLIARLLGHSSTKHVGRYTRPGAPEMQDAFRRLQKAGRDGGGTLQ